MKAIRLLLLLPILLTIVFATGCGGKKKSDSKVPWARPANWENQAPGFGGMSY